MRIVRALVLLAVASCGSSSETGDAGADLAMVTPPSDAAIPDGGAPACAAGPSSAPPVALADFEAGTIPDSDNSLEGFRGSDVARGTIVHPGANGSGAAASFDYGSDNAVFFQGMSRPQYLDGSSTYHPELANAVEFWLRAPSGSALLSAANATLGFWTYHWLSGDPWVGPNAGGNLTDSQMHGYANFRVDPAAADQWTHVVLSTSAFGQSRGNYHFYAARAVAQDQTFFGSLRQLEIVALESLGAGPTALGLDELRLITRPPTAAVCPPFLAQNTAAGGGDLAVPIVIANPTAQARSYHVFASSEIGVDRQTLEVAMHDTDSVAAVDDLQGGVGADGGPGAVELFADDGTGHATGAAVIAGGAPIALAAGASWRGVLVHHVTPAMLGAATQVSTGGRQYSVTRNTLTSSVIVWDPAEPRAGDAAVVGAGSNADGSHPAPPGFPPFAAPPSGWRSTDVPVDQVGGYFVSVITLTP